MVAARNSDLDAAIAATRFGMGAKPGELHDIAGDPRGFLIAQVRPLGAEQPTTPPGGEKLQASAEFFRGERQAIALRRTHEMGNRKEARAMRADVARNEFLARFRLATQTRAGFAERWTLFWCNHFSTARKIGRSQAIVGLFEREAIRPHVFGGFTDMLLAAVHHPTMLLYLDQTRSIGPTSRVGRRRERGLNENLAREVMELHTLGVDAGYTQSDVTEFARALTGWTMDHRDGLGQFVFRPNMHERGSRTILGKTYPPSGEGQALAALKDFAFNPHTAHHLAFKIARHFVADDPPPALVAKLQAAFQEGGGKLDHVAKTLINAPEAWNPQPMKFKAPYEFLVSGWRAVGAVPAAYRDIGEPLRLLGQNVFNPASPKGWDDTGPNWADAAGLMERIKWSSDFAERFAPTGDVVAHAQAVLGPRLTNASITAIRRAETRKEAFALLLMTPEFQRR